jgi:hypothetical protein
MSTEEAKRVAKLIWDLIDVDVLDIPNDSYLNCDDDTAVEMIAALLEREVKW